MQVKIFSAKETRIYRGELNFPGLQNYCLQNFKSLENFQENQEVLFTYTQNEQNLKIDSQIQLEYALKQNGAEKSLKLNLVIQEKKVQIDEIEEQQDQIDELQEKAQDGENLEKVQIEENLENLEIKEKQEEQEILKNQDIKEMKIKCKEARKQKREQRRKRVIKMCKNDKFMSSFVQKCQKFVKNKIITKLQKFCDSDFTYVEANEEDRKIQEKLKKTFLQAKFDSSDEKEFLDEKKQIENLENFSSSDQEYVIFFLIKYFIVFIQKIIMIVKALISKKKEKFQKKFAQKGGKCLKDLKQFKFENFGQNPLVKQFLNKSPELNQIFTQISEKIQQKNQQPNQQEKQDQNQKNEQEQQENNQEDQKYNLRAKKIQEIIPKENFDYLNFVKENLNLKDEELIEKLILN